MRLPARKATGRASQSGSSPGKPGEASHPDTTHSTPMPWKLRLPAKDTLGRASLSGSSPGKPGEASHAVVLDRIKIPDSAQRHWNRVIKNSIGNNLFVIVFACFTLLFRLPPGQNQPGGPRFLFSSPAAPRRYWRQSHSPPGPRFCFVCIYLNKHIFQTLHAENSGGSVKWLPGSTGG